MPENFLFDESSFVDSMRDTREIAEGWQRVLDDVGASWGGRPIDEVKAVLRCQWARAGGQLTDPNLTEWAAALSAGRHVDFMAW